MHDPEYQPYYMQIMPVLKELDKKRGMMHFGIASALSTKDEALSKK